MRKKKREESSLFTILVSLAAQVRGEISRKHFVLSLARVVDALLHVRATDMSAKPEKCFVRGERIQAEEQPKVLQFSAAWQGIGDSAKYGKRAEAINRFRSLCIPLNKET
jgi:hypothetical protein